MINRDRRYHFPLEDKNLNRREFVFTSAIAATASLGATVGGALAIAGPIQFGTALALGAGTLALGGGALYGASKLLPKAPDAQQLPSIPKAPSFEDASKKAKEDTQDKRRAIARNQTIKTDPLGLTPLDKSDLSLKTLTGA